MDSRISIPTDNIYKFYALFGLAFCVAALTMFVLAYNSHFESTTELSMQLAKLDTLAKLTEFEEAQKKILENQIEIGNSNKDFYMTIISASLGFGLVVMISGFIRWHYKVQPQIDKIMALKIEQLQVELSRGKKHVPYSRRRNGA